jgi:hypothetical protein
MMRVSYAGGTFLTSESIAASLLDFTAALGRTEGAESVTIPILTEKGEPATIDLVIGPASQLSAIHETSPFAEPDRSDAVRAMEERTILLKPSLPAETDAPPPVQIDDDFEYQ